MASKLDLWNRALRALRKPRLATLTDNVPTRNELTACWAQCVSEVSEAGLWNFGIVTASLSADTTTIPGYQYGFAHPAAWLRTIAVSTSSHFAEEAEYRDENGAIFCNVTPIFIRYVASTKFADDYVTTWPASFCSAVAFRLAWELAEVLGESTEMRQNCAKEYEAALRRAKNLDAMNQATLKLREGSWMKALRGNTRGRGDRGTLYPVDISFDTTGDV